jgi:hypothetical protein
MKQFLSIIFSLLLVPYMNALDFCVMTSGIDVQIKVKIAERESHRENAPKKLLYKWGKDFVQSTDLYSGNVKKFTNFHKYKASYGMSVVLAYRFVYRPRGKGYVEKVGVKTLELAKKAMCGYQYYGANMSTIAENLLRLPSKTKMVYIIIHPDGTFSNFSIRDDENSGRSEEILQFFVDGLCNMQKAITIYKKEPNVKSAIQGLKNLLELEEDYKKNKYCFGGLEKRLESIIKEIKSTIMKLEKKMPKKED